MYHTKLTNVQIISYRNWHKILEMVSYEKRLLKLKPSNCRQTTEQLKTGGRLIYKFCRWLSCQVGICKHLVQHHFVWTRVFSLKNTEKSSFSFFLSFSFYYDRNFFHGGCTKLTRPFPFIVVSLFLQSIVVLKPELSWVEPADEFCSSSPKFYWVLA